MSRGLIVARMTPASERAVAEIFAKSDATELPHLIGVRHRSLFSFGGLYFHYVETRDDLRRSVDEMRTNSLFQDISAHLERYIQPYDPARWQSPRDAMAREFYSWDAPSERGEHE